MSESYDLGRPFEPAGPPLVHDSGPAVRPDQYGDAEPSPRSQLRLPVILFLATCLTTTMAHGPLYAAALLTILVCHEFGHYLQAVRYRVPASLPFFIPVPFGPLGTMGAVINMRGHIGNRRALFDIGISGPLAGLVPAVILTVIGLKLSTVVPSPPNNLGRLGDSLLFKWFEYWLFPGLPSGHDVLLHPVAFAGWVGILITSINLVPIGQLDGGHILYALMPSRAHLVAYALLGSAILAVAFTGAYQWMLMLMLLILIGPAHPPTGDDEIPLGTGRIILGWLTLAFVIIGFTPQPFMY